jgi:hypothetical protein
MEADKLLSQTDDHEEPVANGVSEDQTIKTLE